MGNQRMSKGITSAEKLSLYNLKEGVEDAVSEEKTGQTYAQLAYKLLNQIYGTDQPDLNETEAGKLAQIGHSLALIEEAVDIHKQYGINVSIIVDHFLETGSFKTIRGFLDMAKKYQKPAESVLSLARDVNYDPQTVKYAIAESGIAPQDNSTVLFPVCNGSYERPKEIPAGLILRNDDLPTLTKKLTKELETKD